MMVGMCVRLVHGMQIIVAHRMNVLPQCLLVIKCNYNEDDGAKPGIEI